MKKIIAFDIGGTHIKYALISSKYKFITSDKVSTNRSLILSQVIEIIKEIFAKDDKGGKDFIGIAIATTGVVDSVNKKIIWTNESMKEYAGIDFSGLEKMFKIPVIVENDANAAALSEKLFNKKLENYAVVTLGTGVGIGIIKSGKLFTGKNFLGGELGYLRFGKQSLDQYLSFSDQSRKMQRNFGISIDQYQKFDDLYHNNPKFQKDINDYFNKIVNFCFQLSIFLNLDQIIISGGFSHIEPKYFSLVQARFYEYMGQTPFKTQLELSQSQNSAGMLGAAYLLNTRK